MSNKIDKTWFGKEILRFVLKAPGGKICYKCVTTTRIISEVIEEIDKIYGGQKLTYKLYCNDTHVFTFNKKKKNMERKIIDKRSNFIYLNINDFMDSNNLSRKDAHIMLRTLSHYEFMD
jgi:hypothetical protein